MPTDTQATDANAAKVQATADARAKFNSGRFARYQHAAFDFLLTTGADIDAATKGAQSVGSFCGLHLKDTEISGVDVTSKGMTLRSAGDKVTKIPASGASILFHRAWMFHKLTKLGVNVLTCSTVD